MPSMQGWISPAGAKRRGQSSARRTVSWIASTWRLVMNLHEGHTHVSIRAPPGGGGEMRGVQVERITIAQLQSSGVNSHNKKEAGMAMNRRTFLQAAGLGVVGAGVGMTRYG